jgi:hypothetical protein
MTTELINDYLMDNPEEFEVVIVESTLGSLISGVNFEKCFVAASKGCFEGVTDLATAQEALRLAGFEVEIQATKGKAYATSKCEISMPLTLWIEIMVGVIATLFEGSVLMVAQHIPTGVKIGHRERPEKIEYLRSYHGIASDSPIEPQLLKFFDIS